MILTFYVFPFFISIVAQMPYLQRKLKGGKVKIDEKEQKGKLEDEL